MTSPATAATPAAGVRTKSAVRPYAILLREPPGLLADPALPPPVRYVRAGVIHARDHRHAAKLATDGSLPAITDAAATADGAQLAIVALASLHEATARTVTTTDIEGL